MPIALSPELTAAAAPLAGQPGIAAGALPMAPSAPSEPLTPAAQPIPSDILAGLPPEPRPGGISESIGNQLIRQGLKNADTMAASSPAPSAPGAWARALVGGMQSALAGAAVGPVPRGAGGLYGAGVAMQRIQEQQKQAQEAAERAKEREFEHEMKLKDEKRADDRAAYESFVHDVNTQKILAASTQDAQDRLHNDIYAPWEKMLTDSGATKVTEKRTGPEILAMAKAHETKDDPNGLGWLSSQMRQQDGWRNVIDAEGNIVQEVGRDGKPTGRAERVPTYSLLSYGEPLVLGDDADSKKIIEQARHFGLGEYTPGTTLEPKIASLLKAQIGQHIAAQHAADELALAAEKPKAELAALQEKEGYQEAGRVLMPWLVDAGGDAGAAMKNIREAASETDPNTNQPTPHAKHAQEVYDTILNGMGTKIVEKSLDLYEKKSIEQIKANAAAAKTKPLELEGNPALDGEAYVDSLPPGRRELIRQLGSGRIATGNLGRILGGKDGQLMMEEAAKAYPDLDVSKMAGYTNLVKEFNVGKTATQIKALNTVIPHLDTLYTAVNSMPSAAVPGVGKIEAMLGSQGASMLRTARTQASQELASVYAAGAVTDQEHREFSKELDTASPWELRNNIVSITDLLKARLQSIREQWDVGAPSPRYVPPRPIISKDAQQALDHISALHSGTEAPHPNFHVFDAKKWAAANPGKDVSKAIDQARQQGYEVQNAPEAK